MRNTDNFFGYNYSFDFNCTFVPINKDTVYFEFQYAISAGIFVYICRNISNYHCKFKQFFFQKNDLLLMLNVLGMVTEATIGAD